MTRRPVPGNHVLRNFLGKRLPLRQPPPERLDKTFVALTALGLSGRQRRVRQWWGGGQPEPHEQREGLVMKIWSELTFAEIATALGISNNTAASRYRYALSALKKNLQPQ